MLVYLFSNYVIDQHNQNVYIMSLMRHVEPNLGIIEMVMTFQPKENDR